MSNKSNQGADFLTPLMEGFTELFQSFAQMLIGFIGDRIQNFIKLNFSIKNEMKIEPKMLENNKQTTNSDHLGYSVNQDGCYKLSYLRPEMHTFIIGASGWGKTNLINILMENHLKNNRPVIFIDPKGTKEAITQFRSLCAKYERKFHIFSPYYPEVMRFNPFESMNSDQAMIMIMRSFDWGEAPNEYYLNQSREALKKTLDKLYQGGTRFGLHDIYKNLETDFNTKETSGLRSHLLLLTKSVYGHLFDIQDTKQTMSIKKAWEERTCIYVGISTLGYGTIARTIGKFL